ncbi:radical SAM family heme chaperone HemW [Christiangramia sp. OXR-203]|jgi:oxygen-independent coproporphyrinogen-3 oxidase|uniref:radical SAM family heme chaperone HemW n=1 Tax=Christiangramia sp. OXR-203 TaxID=3100176 RepID=UPI002AC971FF|nr:radical SAM family heme chaperone HemW [Christiangramia sp. OXR-203]WPY98328.1 radical SAM family heme chaperone HemW [Christiangramia sp. OXR-203]
MSGIYIHIPFCKQACHYCDFHFSTSTKKKGQLVEMLGRELELRKNEIPGPIQTIYFGGGTPSLLSSEELESIFLNINQNFKVSDSAEITLEANPDDLSEEVLKMLNDSLINRLSIGVQSFFEADLKLMNRAHNATEALECLKLAKRYFDNISIDLIYGIPGQSEEQWMENLEIALKLDIPHISSYALTVEPKTALETFIKKGKIQPVTDEKFRKHFDILVQKLTNAGFEHYEFSNYGKPGFHSQNNMAYWLGKPYLGIGPSAHSYDGNTRSWNVANNSLYISALEENKIPQQQEVLSLTDSYNEYIMTRLRTKFGVNSDDIHRNFGKLYEQHFIKQSQIFLENGQIEKRDSGFHISEKGKFLSDGIAAELFYLDD